MIEMEEYSTFKEGHPIQAFRLIGETKVMPDIRRLSSISSDILSSNRLGPNYMWSMHGEGERKFVWGNLGHMTKVTSNPIYGYKILEKLLLKSAKKPGVWHWECWHVMVCLMWDPPPTFFLYMMKGKFSC